MIAQNGDPRARGQGGDQIVEHGFDVIGDGDQIFAAALDDFEAHAGFLVEAGESCALLKPIDDLGHIADIDRTALPRFDEQVADLGNGFEFAGHAHGVFVRAHSHAAAGQGQIFAPNGVDHVLDGEFVRAEAVGVHIDLDFAFEPACYAHFEDAGDGFNLVREVFGDFFQANEAVISRQCDQHHRDIGKVDFKNSGIVCVIGEVWLGQIDLVFDALKRVVEIDIGMKFDRDRRGALDRTRADHFDVFNALKLFFQGASDEVFDILRRGADVRRGDDDNRNGDIGRRLAGQGQIRRSARDDQDADKNVHGHAVFERVCGDGHLLCSRYLTITRSPSMRSRPPLTTS